MDDDTERLPRFSYDLITWLDENISIPTLPTTANAFGRLADEETRIRMAFTAGARAIVDQLLVWRAEEESRDAGDAGVKGEPDRIPDGPELRFPDVFGTDGDVRRVTTPVHLASNISK